MRHASHPALSGPVTPPMVRPPYGVRGCLSRDHGETWDIDREIVIRDDAVSGAISYPSAVQLPDDSIFVYYGTNKPDGDGVRVYAAGSCFTENFVRPRGA